jgi:sugar lactone lactonase YvrE
MIAAVCLVAPPVTGAVGSSTLSVWKVASAPSPVGSWSAVDFANGQWIALGNGAAVAVSPDGSAWTEYPVPLGSWKSVTYGNGQFVALSSVNASPEEMVSTNGVNWSPVTAPAGQ